MKTFYTKSIRPLLVVFTFILLASSCSKKSDPDPLDQYVGSWTETTLNGQADTGDDLTISKSGTTLTLRDFLANDFTATLSGSGIQADNKNINTGATYTFTDNTKGVIYLKNLTGSVSGDKLTLKYTFYSESATKYITVDFTEVFVKK
ncbi:hypothetical protein GO730_01010 [Spirosoma sp. HMF3257]|uniref:Lipocalin-like domain-containing protein n=1 Tax=Spirosoma telluris TaxID=2183553 RepID=A0A327NF23_9BACT|nr:hypothetical protein [Spirosoma telluris]RAI73363.1 hypothetical protein HMF3257_00985 [Spirosoma telluris]